MRRKRCVGHRRVTANRSAESNPRTSLSVSLKNHPQNYDNPTTPPNPWWILLGTRCGGCGFFSGDGGASGGTRVDVRRPRALSCRNRMCARRCRRCNQPRHRRDASYLRRRSGSRAGHPS